ncbi:capsid assembly protein [Caenispirillum bisanense]|uniref:capsid assembly protein n=1 Tax=Caenispirillum bisanense TaxID=414052 RepID=UPI0031DF32A3
MTQLAIPPEFLDPATGQVNLEALLRAYLELQETSRGMVRLPGPEADADSVATFRRALGVPDTPDAYQVTPPHALFGADPQVNARLHAAGFTPQQVQLVYDLAAERILPVLESMASELDGDRELGRLVEHFGGDERWAEVSRQLLAWGKANLPADVLGALSSTADGILALWRMMQSGEPTLGGLDAAAAGPGGEDEIKALMRDPKYWRDRDPTVMRKVADGFKRLYPGPA